MKKQLLTLSLALAAAFAVPAFSFAEDAAAPAGDHPRGPGGPGGGPRQDPATRAKELKEKLSLSDEQTTKITAVFQESHEKMKALRDDTTLSREDRRSKGGDVWKGSSEQIKAILTPEQFTKFEELAKERRSRRGGEGKPGDAGAPK